jgi:diacylglycerol kinase (ATP)
MKADTRRKRAKLIFNPVAGANQESPLRLMEVLREMQAWRLLPEPYLTEPDSDLSEVVRDAIARGIRLFAVCGGDGTVSSVARAMIDTNATLGIIPTGTQNNVAFSLGIPTDIPAAVSMLRTGKRIKADMGIITCGDSSMPFLEICSVGLFSALYKSGDDIQHGNFTRIGDFLATLTSSPPSEINILLDGSQRVVRNGHVVLVSNMPYVGRHYQVGEENSFSDGLLDVLFCADISKLGLMLGYVMKAPGISEEADPRIKNFHVREITIDANPAMTVMADGIILGDGPAHIGIRRHALSVMAPDTSGSLNESGEEHEK